MKKLIFGISGILLFVACLIIAYWLLIGEVARFAIATENENGDDLIIYSLYKYEPEWFSRGDAECVRLLFRDLSVGGYAVYCRSDGRYTVMYEGE